jgi:hypothetical protein
MATPNEGSAKTGSADQDAHPELSRNIAVDDGASPRMSAKGMLTLCRTSRKPRTPASVAAQDLICPTRTEH